jgi:hypothetical protein
MLLASNAWPERQLELIFGIGATLLTYTITLLINECHTNCEKLKLHQQLDLYH